jgi:hypothetical protein
MKRTKIIFWISTSLIAAMMLFSGASNALVTQSSIEVIHKGLGYPLYFIAFIGVAKVLGAIALLIPGVYQIKEWAYAGICFDLIGAAYSIISIGGSFPEWAFIALPLLLLFLSYGSYHKMAKEKVTP